MGKVLKIKVEIWRENRKSWADSSIWWWYWLAWLYSCSNNRPIRRTWRSEKWKWWYQTGDGRENITDQTVNRILNQLYQWRK